MDAPTRLPARAPRECVEKPKGLQLCLLQLDNMTAILDSAADGILTVDEHLRVSHLNRPAESITGFPAKEAAGQPCLDIFRSY